MHVMAAKAVSFGEALKPEFEQYIKNVISNAKILANIFIKRGFRVVTGGTDSHLVWLDLSPKGGKILSKTQLFFASGTWTPPAVSRGLLYIMQNDTDRMSDTPARILCYDLRKN